MKCEIAKDLLTLYAEQLCSEETAKELEQHMEECAACREQLAHYQRTLEQDKNAKNEETAAENENKLRPMKKIRRKMRRRVLLSVVLGCILFVVLGGVGILSYGEMTNKCISFSGIADIARLKKVTKDLTKGETEALVDILAYRVEDFYAIKKQAGFDDMEAFKEALGKNMDKAYAYYFEGRDIRVKFSDMELYPVEESINMGADETTAVNLATTLYYFDFYEDDTLVLGLEFAKIGSESFIVTEYLHDDIHASRDTPSFAPATLPFDTVLMDVLLRYTVSARYEKVLAANPDISYRFLGMSIRNAEPGSAEDKAHKDAVDARMKALLADGWVLKDCLYASDAYDIEGNFWRYKVWFQFENMETGECCMMEQKFCLRGVNLYIMDDQPAQMMGRCESLTPEAEEKMLALFR